MTIADGGEAIAIADLAILRDHTGLFGAVATDVTEWRILSNVDSEALVPLRRARTRTRSHLDADGRDPRRNTVLDRRAVQERISGAHATFNSCGET